MNRTIASFACVVLLLLGWSVYSTVSSPTPTATVSLAHRADGAHIYFVPIGNFPVARLDPLVSHFRTKFGLEITILKGIAVNDSARNVIRQQLVAEQLARSLQSAVPEYAIEPNSILIGFTSEDIYPASQNWRFAFGWRLNDGRTAVISTARMNLLYFGVPLDLHLFATRLLKMTTKDIGILYYGLPQNRNPRSVLYGQIMGIQELDYAGEDF